MFGPWRNVMSLAFRSPPPFSYTPLPPNSIRLLIPCSPNSSDDYSWKLEVVDLDQPDLVFDALSYVWGSPDESYPIICNDKLMHVHCNLYTALPYQARRDADEEALAIWIDAICIDQNNQEEKMAQIPLMNCIYRKAEIVWAWLGLAEYQIQIQLVIQLLPVLHAVGLESRQFERDFGQRRNTALEGLDPSFWSALLHLTNNEWYRRIWVIQEAALAQNLLFMCGDHQITCEQICGAISDLVALGSTVDSHGKRLHFIDNVSECDTVFHIRDMVQSYMRIGNPLVARTLMLDILSLTASSHQCSQSQDRVIGMLGLVDKDDLQTAGICAMPSEYLTPEETYSRFSTSLLTNTHTHCPGWYSYFDLAMSSHPERNTALPSWGPDLHHIGLTPSYALSNRVRLFEEAEFPGMFQASSRTGKLVRGSARSDQLFVGGKLIDEIAAVYEEIPTYPADPGFNTPEFVRQVMEYLGEMLDWEEWLSRTLLGDRQGPTTVVAEDSRAESLVSIASYWQMLHWDVQAAGPADDARDRYRDFRIYSRRFLETAVIDDDATPEQRIDGTELLSTPISSRLEVTVANMKHLEGRQLFRTKRGFFGYTKRGVQAGDVVCLITGLPVFHVLSKAREAVEEQTVWKIIGDAYVQGFMNGEVDDLDIDVEDVVLV